MTIGHCINQFKKSTSYSFRYYTIACTNKQTGNCCHLASPSHAASLKMHFYYKLQTKLVFVCSYYLALLMQTLFTAIVFGNNIHCTEINL
jgi:hypothetical protein